MDKPKRPKKLVIQKQNLIQISFNSRNSSYKNKFECCTMFIPSRSSGQDYSLQCISNVCLSPVC